MPDSEEILKSVQLPGSIKDPVLSSGEPIRIRRGVERYSGGFAIVFPIVVNDAKWAFRCWTTDLGNLERRMKVVSDELGKLNLPYFSDFHYEPEGIEVNGKLYPTTRMKWVEGENIAKYIYAHRKEKNVLLKLADDFLKMCKLLHSHHIAHGDLQHGNILVGDDGGLHLVDYDSVYVPGLSGSKDIVAGDIKYQHPNRKDNVEVNEKLDYFSELVIYLSILGVAEDAKLAKKHNLEDGDNLLFAEDDYKDFENSKIFKELSKLSVKIQQLLGFLKDYLGKSSILNLEPFDLIYERSLAKLEVSKNKIKKGAESVRLSWTVVNAEKVVLYANDKKVQECSLKDSLTTKPLEDTEYRIDIYETSDSQPIQRAVKIAVRPEATVEFTSDKNYVLPTVPIKLSWDVKDAIKVKYNGKEVKYEDFVWLEEGIESETEFTLTVTDEFGTKDHRLKVRMMPLPIIDAVLVPTPKIESSLSVVTNQSIEFKDTKTVVFDQTNLNMPLLNVLDLELPDISHAPIGALPQFEMPKTFFEKVDGRMTDLTNSLHRSIRHAVDSISSKIIKQ